MIEPYSDDLGYAQIMGSSLREFVVRSLINDLNCYSPYKKFTYNDCIFDWSKTCIEGHRIEHLDGAMENFSNIGVFDRSYELIAAGWMDFIEDGDAVHVFWWFLDSGPKYKIKEKRRSGIPKHIWNKLSNEGQDRWRKDKPHEKLP